MSALDSTDDEYIFRADKSGRAIANVSAAA